MITLSFYLILTVIVLGGLSYILPVEVPGIHGSASFDRSHLSSDNTGLIVDGERSIPLKKSFEHALILAPTGSGKTTRYIIPNVLRCAGSMIVTDPKGEVHQLTKTSLERRGYTVKALDFSNPKHSIRYNPIKRANTRAEIRELAVGLYNLTNKGTSEGAIWKQGAVRLYTVLIEALKNAPANAQVATMSSLLRLLTHLEDGTTTARDFIMKYADAHGQALFQTYNNAEAKIKSGQYNSAHAALANWDTDELQQITNKDDIDFKQFRQEKTALFLILPPGTTDRFSPLIALLYKQLFYHFLTTPLQKDDLPVFFLADEFGNTPRIHDFDKSITLLRSQKVSISIILQSLSQLDEKYGKFTTETILGNAATFLCYSGLRSDRDLKFVSSLLGTKTVESHAPGSFVQYYSRPLMTPQEIRCLPDEQGLLVLGNRPVKKIFPVPIFKNITLLEQHGLQSVDGKLVPVDQDSSTEETLDLTQAPRPLLPVTLETTTNEHLDRFRQQINNLFPQQNSNS